MGIVYLLFCWTLIPALVSLIEGILFLTMSEAEFEAKYGNGTQSGTRIPVNYSNQPSSSPSNAAPSPYTQYPTVTTPSASNRNWLIYCTIAVFACFACSAIFAVIGMLLPTESSEVTGEISTDKGIIHVPGIAYVDGRDLESDPVSTIMSVNVWDSPSRNRTVCQISHGTEVNVVSARFSSSENRHYIKISDDICEGWVSEPFISAQYNAPVGVRN